MGIGIGANQQPTVSYINIVNIGHQYWIFGEIDNIDQCYRLILYQIPQNLARYWRYISELADI